MAGPWMSDPGIQALPLEDVLLPGTHDSGTDTLASSYTPLRTSASHSATSAARALAALQWLLPHKVAPWTLCQEGMPVSEQLAAGVRFLDLRVAFPAVGSGAKPPPAKALPAALATKPGPATPPGGQGTAGTGGGDGVGSAAATGAPAAPAETSRGGSREEMQGCAGRSMKQQPQQSSTGAAWQQHGRRRQQQEDLGEPVLAHTFACGPLRMALRQVAQFLDAHASEVVVLRLGPNWPTREAIGPEEAAVLLAMLRAEVGEHLYRRSSSNTGGGFGGGAKPPGHGQPRCAIAHEGQQQQHGDSGSKQHTPLTGSAQPGPHVAQHSTATRPLGLPTVGEIVSLGRRAVAFCEGFPPPAGGAASCWAAPCCDDIADVSMPPGRHSTSTATRQATAASEVLARLWTCCCWRRSHGVAGRGQRVAADDEEGHGAHLAAVDAGTKHSGADATRSRAARLVPGGAATMVPGDAAAVAGGHCSAGSTHGGMPAPAKDTDISAPVSSVSGSDGHESCGAVALVECRAAQPPPAAGLADGSGWCRSGSRSAVVATASEDAAGKPGSDARWDNGPRNVSYDDGLQDVFWNVGCNSLWADSPSAQGTLDGLLQQIAAGQQPGGAFGNGGYWHASFAATPRPVDIAHGVFGPGSGLRQLAAETEVLLPQLLGQDLRGVRAVCMDFPSADAIQSIVQHNLLMAVAANAAPAAAGL